MTALSRRVAVLSLAGIVCGPAVAAVAESEIRVRARAWHWQRAEMLERLLEAERQIRDLGGVPRVPPALAVRFDQASLQAGLEIIAMPARDLGDVTAKIGIARELDLPELRVEYATDAVGTILADVEALRETCNSIEAMR